MIYTGVLGSFLRVGDAGDFSLFSGSVCEEKRSRKETLLIDQKSITMFADAFVKRFAMFSEEAGKSRKRRWAVTMNYGDCFRTNQNG